MPAPAGLVRPFEVVVVGASLGGLAVLEHMCSVLPKDFPVPILVVQHTPAHATSMLPDLLQRHTRLQVCHARDGEFVGAGKIYVAPPGRHLLVGAEGQCVLSNSPPVNFARPAADLLFQSAARLFGPTRSASSSQGDYTMALLEQRRFDVEAGSSSCRRRRRAGLLGCHAPSSSVVAPTLCFLPQESWQRW